MTKKDLIIFRDVAEFILDNREQTIVFLNENGYAHLSRYASVKYVNDAIANNLLNQAFVLDFARFIDADGYSNWYQVVIAIATAITNVVVGAVDSTKRRLFGEQMAHKQGVYDRETEQWYKDQAELKAKKEASLMLSNLQSDIILKRELMEDKKEQRKTLYTMLMFMGGAVALAVLAIKLRKK
jgi:hypothetical protein